MRWTTLRFDAFRAAARSDRLYARAADLLRSLLFDYDAEHDADLGATAEAFAAAYGEVSRTAEALFQHPNTVRYRLKKIKEVLSVQDATDRRTGGVARAGVPDIARLPHHWGYRREGGGMLFLSSSRSRSCRR